MQTGDPCAFFEDPFQTYAEIAGRLGLSSNSIEFTRDQTAADLGPSEFEFEPPQPVLDTVLRLGRRPDYLKRFGNFIVASLTFDSSSSPATAGGRRTENASREMSFETSEIQVALSIRPSGNRKITLTGQVSQKNAAPIEDSAAQVDLFGKAITLPVPL